MFSLKVVDTDSFLDMSPTAQNLYFHLGMRADDDGFIANPKRIQKMIGAPEDDLKILYAKNFIIPMATNGVSVVTHWKVNNLIKGDRYTPTIYLEEKQRLMEDNGIYKVDILGSKMVPKVDPQVRLGKDRLLGADAPITITYEDEDKPQRKDSRSKDKMAVFSLFSEKKELWFYHKQQREAALRLFDRGLDRLEAGLAIMRDNEDDPYCPKAHTPFEYEQKLPKLNAYKKKNGL